MAVLIHPYDQQHCWLPIGSPAHQSLVVSMLHQLQVGQVGHWDFFGGHLDHSNETQTHSPHDCHSIDGHEV